MLKFAVLAVLSFAFGIEAGENKRIVYYGRGYGTQPLPAFDKGYLLFTHHDEPDGVEVWGPDGKLVFKTGLATHPDGHVMSAAIDSDGSVAVGIGYSGSTLTHRGGIAFLDRSGKEIRFVDTDRYMPAHVCFDANHILWTFGWQRDIAPNDTADSEDYFLFRKYTTDGDMLGAYAKRSSFPRPGLEPGSPQGGLWRLRIANDRVGALAYSGHTSASREWIELGLDGHLIGHWKIGAEVHGGEAFLSRRGLCRQTM